MRKLRITLKPACKLLVILMFLSSFFHQYASAAMVDTERLLKQERNPTTRDRLHHWIARENIQEALVAWGIDPNEARARINSLTDSEIDLIAAKIDQLPAGGDAFGFIVISLVVIFIVFVILEYTSSVKMLPQLQFGD